MTGDRGPPQASLIGPGGTDATTSVADEPCPAAGARSTDDASSPRIVEAYPNPTTDGNVGEYLVIDDPGGPTENLTVTDGHASTAIPDDRPPGRVAASLDPNVTAELTDDHVVEFDGYLRLAADGDELVLANESGTTDAIVYGRAAEGEIWYRTGDAIGSRSEDESTAPVSGDWWPRDATCLEPSTRSIDEATAFVLPDTPEVPLEAIAGAEERIRVAGYTFTDEEIAAELEAALDRGVEVEVLVEAGPVGGIPEETEPLLSELEGSGATVRAIGGEGARYGFHHPKYAVIDDAVLVTSENWKPAGVGGASSRGWGVIVDDADLAAELATVFDADADGPDTTNWSAFRQRTTFVEEDAAAGSFERGRDAETVTAERAELLVAPDNAEDRLRELIEGAEDSLRIVQVRIDGPDFVLLDAALEAARDGAEVRILLDDSWYVAEENRALADRLDSIAEREELSLEVRLAEGGSRFEKVHAKGIVVDEETAVVGSLNWNDQSLRENREVALVLHGDDVGTYYADAFDADWASDGDWQLPVELVLAVLTGLAIVLVLGRRYVRVDPTTRTAADPRAQVPVTIRPAGSEASGAEDVGRHGENDGYGGARSNETEDDRRSDESDGYGDAEANGADDAVSGGVPAVTDESADTASGSVRGRKNPSSERRRTNGPADDRT
ncbi:phospholipase D-like domain-containing protein [Halovivax sp.]|uniref:phospholipase D-like domain-containing protein n=1 Tax=Halovivax sp. TaxID=1935978 RepID=UPI0025C48B4E|nr:phospholipase D-like domain-containing protein [Halovivax sp.]